MGALLARCSFWYQGSRQEITPLKQRKVIRFIAFCRDTGLGCSSQLSSKVSRFAKEMEEKYLSLAVQGFLMSGFSCLSMGLLHKSNREKTMRTDYESWVSTVRNRLI